MTIADIARTLENWAPLALQESYDNSGLIVGDANAAATGATVSFDVTEEVLDEAIARGHNLVVAHHPAIFGGLKRITGRTLAERVVAKAIKSDIALYAVHTNLDNVATGVNAMLCRRLGLENTRILQPKKNALCKLKTYVPDQSDEQGHVPTRVRQAMWDAGAGTIGKYDQCSFNVKGQGTFRALPGADPHLGEIGQAEQVEEVEIEVVLPAFKTRQVVDALMQAHPYEEVAYDLVPLENEWQQAGAGMVGDLPRPLMVDEFLQLVKARLQAGCVRHTEGRARTIQKVAVCGGSGSFLIPQAIAAGADAFVTGDVKYHQMFDVAGQILIADPGHYETEQYTVELTVEHLQRELPNFAVLKSGANTNPVRYF